MLNTIKVTPSWSYQSNKKSNQELLVSLTINERGTKNTDKQDLIK